MDGTENMSFEHYLHKDWFYIYKYTYINNFLCITFMILTDHCLLLYSALTVSLTLHNMQLSKQSTPHRLYNLEDKHEW